MKDYLNYLQEVLGIQNVIMEKEHPSFENAARFFSGQGIFEPQEPPHFELVFLNIVTQAKESLFRPEVAELFQKMKSAMKIKNIQVQELDCTVEDRAELPAALAKVCEAKVVVVFSAFPKDMGDLIFKGPGKWLETYSPAYLLEDPAAKKAVWNDLQKIMGELSL